MMINNNIGRTFAVGLMSLCIAGGAHAAADFNKTINTLGVQKSGPLAYFNTVEALSITNCAWGLIYMDISTDFGKSAFSYLMAGRISGKKLTQITYSQAAGNVCYLDSIDIER